MEGLEEEMDLGRGGNEYDQGIVQNSQITNKLLKVKNWMTTKGSLCSLLVGCKWYSNYQISEELPQKAIKRVSYDLDIPLLDIDQWTLYQTQRYLLIFFTVALFTTAKTCELPKCYPTTGE